MFTGSIVALVTPMQADGAIDEVSFRNLLSWHLSEGTHGIVINGTTGESATLSSSEKLRLLMIAVEVVAGKIPVIAGTGTNSTATTIEETKAAIAAGVDGCLVVTPYYNRPTQEGLYQHYQAVATNCNIPLLLYNVPKRTGCDLLPETVIRLANIQNIVGIKEATGDVARVAPLRAGCRKDFILLSGDDGSTLRFLQAGGDGVISVVANVMPNLFAKLCALKSSDVAQAVRIDKQLYQLYQALGLESNPIPVKWALAYLGRIGSGIRLPLTPLDVKYHVAVQAALAE